MNIFAEDRRINWSHHLFSKEQHPKLYILVSKYQRDLEIKCDIQCVSSELTALLLLREKEDNDKAQCLDLFRMDSMQVEDTFLCSATARYAKAFNSGKRGSFNDKLHSIYNDDQLKIHNQVIELRNGVVAHHSASAWQQEIAFSVIAQENGDSELRLLQFGGGPRVYISMAFDVRSFQAVVEIFLKFLDQSLGGLAKQIEKELTVGQRAWLLSSEAESYNGSTRFKGLTNPLQSRS